MASSPSNALDTNHKRVIIASSIGTMFEWYDFYLYGSLAPIIAKQFFSALDPQAAQLVEIEVPGQEHGVFLTQGVITQCRRLERCLGQEQLQRKAPPRLDLHGRLTHTQQPLRIFGIRRRTGRKLTVDADGLPRHADGLQPAAEVAECVHRVLGAKIDRSQMLSDQSPPCGVVHGTQSAQQVIDAPFAKFRIRAWSQHRGSVVLGQCGIRVFNHTANALLHQQRLDLPRFLPQAAQMRRLFIARRSLGEQAAFGIRHITLGDERPGQKPAQ